MKPEELIKINALQNIEVAGKQKVVFEEIAITAVDMARKEEKERSCKALEPKEEKTFPRVMLVNNGGNEWYKRVVFMKKSDRFLAWFSAETIEESESIYETGTWRYAKELPEKVELTKAEIAEKFGVSVDKLVIKDD